jgi:hypothetical protein
MKVTIINMKKAHKKRSLAQGAISRTLLILAAVVFVLIIGVFLSIKFAINKNTTNSQNTTTTTTTGTNQTPTPTPQLVYEKQLGDVDFTMESATDLGNILTPSMVKAGYIYNQNLTTTEHFIQVVIGAQDKGKAPLQQFSWQLGNIIDSDGRIFPVDDNAYPWLPKMNTCGAALKPEFDPISCTQIYEVSKVSTGLKIEIQASNSRQKGLLDLNLNR